MLSRLIALLASTMLFVAAPAHAKPMMPATPEEAVKWPLIVTAKFVGYELPKQYNQETLYMSGLVATYDVGKVLKNKATPPGLPQTIKVNYAFHDGSACLADQSWHFEAKQMPKKGSSWILFLMPQSNQAFSTYRGDYGRWPATNEQLKRVEELLQTPAQP